MRLAAALAAVFLPSAALAACPLELAVYASMDGELGIDFTPNYNAGASVTNSFKLVTPDGVVPGHVQWSTDAPRSIGSLLLDCPQGDATGEELAACTIWQGVIYSIALGGTVGLLPEQGKPAPEQLVLSGLGPALAGASSLKMSNLPASDVFHLSGCQE